jgi:hypothetical protein
MSTARTMRRLLSTSISATALAAAALFIAPTSAQASDTGLFGAGDPTYDGVFRQSLAIMGLESTGNPIPASSVTWLLEQQCSNGSFESYRENTTAECATSDPINYSGPDSNSTAMGAIALYLAGKTSEARKAVTWLNGIQNNDSGFPYYAGGESDANSTGLSILALRTVQPQDRSARVPNAERFLGTLRLKCASGGGLSFQKGQPANAMASAQALMGMVGTVPVTASGALTTDPTCAPRTAANAGSYLASAMRSAGALPDGFGAGNDYTSTGFAILALSAGGAGRAAVTKATATLRTDAAEYAMPKGAASPGALGMLLMVAEATGSSTKDFGGLNLVKELRASARTS